MATDTVAIVWEQIRSHIEEKTLRNDPNKIGEWGPLFDKCEKEGLHGMFKGKTFTLAQVQTFIKDQDAVKHVFGEEDTAGAVAMIQGAINALSPQTGSNTAPPTVPANPNTGTTHHSAVPPAKQPVLKLYGVNLADSIPFQHHATQPSLKELEELLATRGMDNVGISIFDVPGAGKSSTVNHAALRTQSAYVRVRVDRGVLSSAKLQMTEAIKTLSPNLTLSELQVKLQDFCCGALLRVFSHCSEKLEAEPGNIQFGQIIKNGAEPCTLEVLVTKCLGLMEQITQTTTKDTSFVLHIDEAHAWAVPSQLERKGENDIIEPAHYKDYFFVILSNVFEELRSRFPMLKVAITGTNVLLDLVIRFASQFKVHQVFLAPLSATDALLLCEAFLDLSALSPDDKFLLAEQIAYNGRSIQYFLWRVYVDPKMSTKEADTLTLAMLQPYVDEAYTSWLGTIVNDISSFKTGEESYTTFMEMLLVFAYPAAFSAVRQMSGAVRFTPASSFPAKWLQLAQAGAMKVKKIGNDSVDMYEPKGFLLRWITEKLSQKVDKNTAMIFFAYAVTASNDHVGAPGHFFERAVAAELTMPKSPLYKKIIAGIHTSNTPRSHLLTPNPSLTLKPLKFAAKIESHVGHMDSVYCVMDMNNVANRNIDVGFSLNVVDKTQVNTWLEVKTEKSEAKLWRDALRFFNLPLAAGFRVFISLYPFTHYTPNQRSTSDETLSAKESQDDWNNNKCNAVDMHNRRLYTIIEGIANFKDCFLPFSQNMKDLNPEDMQLFPGEEDMPFSVILEQLLPAVIAAKDAGCTRAPIKFHAGLARAGTFSTEDVSMND